MGFEREEEMRSSRGGRVEEEEEEEGKAKFLSIVERKKDGAETCWNIKFSLSTSLFLSPPFLWPSSGTSFDSSIANFHLSLKREIRFSVQILIPIPTPIVAEISIPSASPWGSS